MSTSPSSSTDSRNAEPRRHRPLVVKLLLLTVASFAFGLALVPFYDTLCKAVGFNGKTLQDALNAGEVKEMRVDTSRVLTVQFTSTLMPGLEWEIKPEENAVVVHPGEMRTTRFLVRNLSTETVRGHLRDHPFEDFFARNARLLPNGRLIHDMLTARIKKPAEMKHPWDYYEILGVVPAAEAFRPIEQSKCPAGMRF